MDRKRAAAYLLVAALALSGLALAVRLLFGPIGGPIPVRAPLNPEGWFALSLTILLAVRSQPGASALPPPARPWTAAAILALAAVILASLWRALPFSFLADDFVLVHYARAHPAMVSLFTTAGGDGFFRPLGYLSLWLTGLFAGADPLKWHIAALVIHMVNASLLLALLLRLGCSRPAAFVAAMLFAIHGTRPEAVVWVAGRFDLLASFFFLAALLLYLRDRRIAALLAMVLALLSKESAFVLPLLLLFLPAAKTTRREHIRGLMPFFAAAAAVFVYRWTLLGGIGGYRDAHTGNPAALAFGLPTLKALALRIWAALYFPINWTAGPERWLALLTLACLAALVAISAARPQRSLAVFAVAAILACSIPPLHLLGISADLGNSRLLYLPSFGFCVLIAAALDALRPRSRALAAILILAFHAAALQHNLSRWQYVSAKMPSAAAIAIACLGPDPRRLTDFGLPGALDGVPFFANVSAATLDLPPAAAPPQPQPSAPHSLAWDPAHQQLLCADR